jgi:hypothetical protein
VEPSSVTPFTLPVLERALHAVMCAWVRQTGHARNCETPLPLPTQPLKRAAEALKSRLAHLGSAAEPKERARMEADLKAVFARRLKEWQSSNAKVWSNQTLDIDDGDQPLLRYAGSACRVGWEELAWPTPNSLRGVDGETQLIISTQYGRDEETVDGTGIRATDDIMSIFS